MTALDNPRWERFAQEIASGKHTNNGAAYIVSGYDCDPLASEAAASRLLRKVKQISERVKELQEKAAIRTELTVQGLLEDADTIMRGAMNSGQWAAANAALQTRAKLAGKWVDRKEVGSPGEFDQLQDHDLAKEMQREIAEIGPSLTDLAAKPNGKAH